MWKLSDHNELLKLEKRNYILWHFVQLFFFIWQITVSSLQNMNLLFIYLGCVSKINNDFSQERVSYVKL